ncbi:MAG TPA: hypothetical protein VGK54_06545, partial [Chloroflexota bacterium]
HRAGGAPEKHAQDTYAVRIELVPQAIRDGPQRVLARGTVANSGETFGLGIADEILTQTECQNRRGCVS